MNISAVNLKLRKYLKKTGDGISKDDEDVLDVIERAFGLKIFFQLSTIPRSKNVNVNVWMTFKGETVQMSFGNRNGLFWSINAETLRTGAHDIVMLFWDGCRLEFNDTVFEIPPFKSAAELKMKLELKGNM